MNPDTLFKNYLKKQMLGKKIDFAQFEQEVPKLYNQWLTCPAVELNNVSPKEYFNKCTDAKELLDAAFETLRLGEDPDTLLSNRLSQLTSGKELLVEALENGTKEEKRYVAGILENSVFMPIEEFLSIAIDENEDEELRDIAIEALKENRLVKDLILDRFSDVNAPAKKVLIEILITLGDDDRTLELLTELLYSGEIAFASNAAIEYGDSRIVYAMLPLLENCNYVDYVELRNAIISLGGEVETEKDFSEDQDFISIKKQSEEENK